MCIIVALGATNVFGYHDPDLNYHLNQLQSFDNSVQKGYNYPVPSVQLSTAGVKIAGAPAFNQALNTQSYTYAKTGYSNIGYQHSFLPQQTYLQPAVNFNLPLAPQPAVYSTQKEAHGYATSAGLSSYTGGQRTVTPLATYAQAPIIAKITAAPLIAKFAAAPFANQNYISGYNSANTVVSQVIAAPSATYAASPPLRVQNSVVNAQSGKYVEAVAQNAIPGVPASQYSNQAASSSFVSSGSGHFAASVSPVVNVQTIPSVQTQQFFLPNQYAAPVHSVPVTHYSSPASQVSLSPVSHAPPPVIGHVAAPVVAKNVHTEFLENYVSISIIYNFILPFY